LCGAEAWTLWKADHKYPVSFEMWCYRRTENISWTDFVRIKVLNGVEEERNILHTVKRRKVNWIGHILGRNCFLEHDIGGEVEGRKEVMRRGRRRKQLMHDLKEKGRN
jgi:hypothetical protein